jgi:hypothetical protein
LKIGSIEFEICFGFRIYDFRILGDHGEGEIPVPIPNTEVKPFSADGTAWATVWESRTLPRLNEKPVSNDGLFLSIFIFVHFHFFPLLIILLIMASCPASKTPTCFN